MRERRDPRLLWKEAGVSFTAALQLIKDLPAEITRMVRRVENDDLTVKFHHKGLEDVSDAFNVASNRVTLGVIIGSLLIGSSLVITTGVRPLWFGYPALGLVGYLLSALLGMYIIVDIIRHGRHR